MIEHLARGCEEQHGGRVFPERPGVDPEYLFRIRNGSSKKNSRKEALAQRIAAEHDWEIMLECGKKDRDYVR
jgi:hypothetical protein